MERNQDEQNNHNQNNNDAGAKQEKDKNRDEKIEKTGEVTLDENEDMENIHLISIIGEIEGHDILGNNSKTTKYEHLLPSLAAIEDSREV